LLCDNPTDSPCGGFDRPDGAGFPDRDTLIMQGVSHGRYCFEGFCAAIAWGEHTAFPLARFVMDQFIHLTPIKHAGVQLMLSRGIHPAFMKRKLLIGFGYIQNPLSGETYIGPHLSTQLFPLVDAVDDNRQFCRITGLLTDPPPVATRLFSSNAPFVTNQNPHAGFHQKPGCADTDNTTTDHNNVCFGREWIGKTDRACI
jgi:hypothetical protein